MAAGNEGIVRFMSGGTQRRAERFHRGRPIFPAAWKAPCRQKPPYPGGGPSRRSAGAVGVPDENALPGRCRVAIRLLPRDRDRGVLGGGNPGPHGDVSGLVERTDGDEYAGGILQPRLVEPAVVEARQSRDVQRHTPAGGRLGQRRLDNGRFYQAWLKNAAGILVPIGTFNQSGDVTLWSGVPPTQYPTITVTRQQANGNPASSGQRVLIGHAHRTS